MNILDFRANVLWEKYHPRLGEVNTGSINAVVLPFVIFAVFLITLLLIVRFFFRIRKTLQEPAVLLELTPPAITEKSSYTTSQFFSVIHTLGKQTFLDKLLGKKNTFSFEIVSTQNQGIRYLLRTSPKQVNTLKHHILSYLPQVNVKVVNEYLPDNKNVTIYKYKVIELKQTKHFAYPLEKQNALDEHDPVAYITGMMTKLSPGELISFQMILVPTKLWETKKIKHMIFRGEDVVGYLDRFNFPPYLQLITLPLKVIIKIGIAIGNLASYILQDLADARAAQRDRERKYMMNTMTITNQRPARVLTQFEQQAVQSVEEKIDQKIFQARMRLLMVVKDKDNLDEREKGFLSSLAVFSGENDQSLVRKFHLNINPINKYLFLNFKKRLLSFVFNSSPTILSVSEVSDLYHFPYTRVTQTENIVKVHSKTLPAPVSLKRADNLDLIFAKNTYGGTTTMIGLNKEERRRHVYILGATGTGKSTLLLSMILQDIANGKGICVIDPHGDLIEKILPSIPKQRTADVIYFNPDDVTYPIGLNLLETSKGLSEEDSLREKEFITESIISLFHKIYSEKFSGPRMEYILRNTIHTAFTTLNPTLFTVYKLLINTKYRNSVVNSLTDENLKDFWKYEFSKAGDYQKVKMISPITNKIGRFLFSATAKRILEQEKSSINFDEIMDTGKILLCNLSKGKIGEDTSEVFGGLVLTKIQLAALKRARVDSESRKDFYLYVDEFQNFATPSFAQILSEARKYRLNAILAHQTTSQLKDKDLVNVTLANTGTIICFRTANPEDEKLILPQFMPYITQGEIANLPSYHFYMKNNALEPEEPFSGETISVEVEPDKKKFKEIIETSRKQYAKEYEIKESEVTEKIVPQEMPQDLSSISALP